MLSVESPGGSGGMRGYGAGDEALIVYPGPESFFVTCSVFGSTVCVSPSRTNVRSGVLSTGGGAGGGGAAGGGAPGGFAAGGGVGDELPPVLEGFGEVEPVLPSLLAQP